MSFWGVDGYILANFLAIIGGCWVVWKITTLGARLRHIERHLNQEPHQCSKCHWRRATVFWEMSWEQNGVKITRSDHRCQRHYKELYGKAA